MSHAASDERQVALDELEIQPDGAEFHLSQRKRLTAEHRQQQRKHHQPGDADVEAEHPLTPQFGSIEHLPSEGVGASGFVSVSFMQVCLPKNVDVEARRNRLARRAVPGVTWRLRQVLSKPLDRERRKASVGVHGLEGVIHTPQRSVIVRNKPGGLSLKRCVRLIDQMGVPEFR